MDRLTKKVYEPGALPVPTEFGIDFIPAQDSQTYYRFMRLVAKLWDYEESGLTPKDVRLLRNCIADVSEQYNMVYDRVLALTLFAVNEQERDYVKLPCKIGDTCWAIRRTQGGKRIFQSCISEMYFDFHMNLIVVARRVCRGKVGRDIFLSFQEAHAFLENENRKEEK